METRAELKEGTILDDLALSVFLIITAMDSSWSMCSNIWNLLILLDENSFKRTYIRLPILKIALLAVNNFVVMLASRCQIAWSTRGRHEEWGFLKLYIYKLIGASWVRFQHKIKQWLVRLRYGAIKVLSQSDKMKNEVYGLGVLFLLLLIPEWKNCLLVKLTEVLNDFKASLSVVSEDVEGGLPRTSPKSLTPPPSVAHWVPLMRLNLATLPLESGSLK